MTGSECRTLRESTGLDQEEFAAILGVSRPTITRWENGTRGVSEPMARLIVRVVTEHRTTRRKGGKNTSDQ